MSESNVLPAGFTDDEKAEREIFLRFHYPDLKDAYKQGFTVIAAVFVFSSTLGERVGARANVHWSWRLFSFSPYALFVLSLVVCSVGYYVLSVSGDKATNLGLWGFWIRSWNRMSFKACAQRATAMLQVSGGLFVMGLLMLAVVAVT